MRLGNIRATNRVDKRNFIEKKNTRNVEKIFVNFVMVIFRKIGNPSKYWKITFPQKNKFKKLIVDLYILLIYG